MYTDIPCLTVIKESDAAVGSPCFVYWITIQDSGGNITVELNDSTDDSGTDKWAGGALQHAQVHAVFDPPIQFLTDCWVDIAGTTEKVTVGYTTQRR